MLTSTGSWDISLVLRKSRRLNIKRLSPLPSVWLLRRNVEKPDCVVFNLHCFLLNSINLCQQHM